MADNIEGRRECREQEADLVQKQGISCMPKASKRRPEPTLAIHIEPPPRYHGVLTTLKWTSTFCSNLFYRKTNNSVFAHMAYYSSGIKRQKSSGVQIIMIITRLYIYLGISVTERATERAHGIRDPDTRRIDTELNDILQGSVCRWREVEHRVGASNGVLAGLEILVLPDPPSAVDLGVVQEEVRVAGGSEEISACQKCRQ